MESLVKIVVLFTKRIVQGLTSLWVSRGPAASITSPSPRLVWRVVTRGFQLKVHVSL